MKNGRHRAALNILSSSKLSTSLLSLNKDADAVAFEAHRIKYLEIFKKLRAEHPDAPATELEKLATERVVAETPKSRAFYRIQVRLPIVTFI